MALAVKAAVRREIPEMRIAGDFWDALDKRIRWEITRAVERAKANGRKTVRASDL